MTIEKKMNRIRKVFVLAAALGCCSASFSGVLASLALQPAGVATQASSVA